MNKPSSTDGVPSARQPGFLVLLALLLLVLAVLFNRSFTANQVLFSNDGPLGTVKAEANKMTLDKAGSVWQDLNWLGAEGISPSPNFSMAIVLLLKPLGYAKFAAPIGLPIPGPGRLGSSGNSCRPPSPASWAGWPRRVAEFGFLLHSLLGHCGPVAVHRRELSRLAALARVTKVHPGDPGRGLFWLDWPWAWA